MPKLSIEPLRETIFRKTEGIVEEKHIEELPQEFEILIFKVGDRLYGITLQWIKEIIEMIEIIELPRSPAFIEGAIDLRGKLVPVIDLRRIFEVEPSVPILDNHIIILNIHEITIGVIVDSVIDFLTVKRNEIHLPQGELPVSELLIGIVEREKPIFIINAGNILTEEQLKSLKKISL